MAKAAAELGEQVDVAGAPQSPVKARLSPAGPVPLDPMLSFGATFFGTYVRTVRLQLVDGRVMDMDIGRRLVEDADDDDDGQPSAVVTDKERNILQAVEEMGIGEVASADVILGRAGHPVTGKSRKFLQRLAAYGILKPDRLGWERVK